MQHVKKHIFQPRSDEVQQILSRPPAWIIRWGTTVAFIFLLVLFGIACIIPSPVVVPVSIKLATGADARFIATARLPQTQFVKVKKGQHVVIRLDAYNYREYGSLAGTVVWKGDTFQGPEGYFDVLISLPAKDNMEYKKAMSGQADIVIAERRLIQQLMPF